MLMESVQPKMIIWYSRNFNPQQEISGYEVRYKSQIIIYDMFTDISLMYFGWESLILKVTTLRDNFWE